MEGRPPGRPRTRGSASLQEKLVAFTLPGLVWLGMVALAAADPAPELPSVTYHGQVYLVRAVDPKKEDLRLFWKDDQGHLMKDFAGLEKAVADKGEKLLFAANAGMYEADFSPVGLLVQNGHEVSPLNVRDATGNFYLKPNGVFVINEKHEALIVQSGDYVALLTPPVWATQSGPMLVLHGDIHPEFNAESKNVNIRSGVGVRKDGMVEFAISRKPVTFYEFASLFLNQLKCPNALFLDGTISAFYAPGMKDPVPHGFGPMIGIVEDAKKP
jgi:uncharacterized protein YigE (DUF2233 family)